MDNQDGTDWVYSEEVKKHFFEPQNLLMEDPETFNADGVGYVGSPACGDMMKIWIKVDKNSDKIVDLKWKTFGCASAIASTSVLSVMVLENGGMKIEDALKITPQDITARLAGLPDRKIHCSVLGDKALQAAVNDYFSKSGQRDRITKEEVSVVCDCLGVTNREIEEAVLEGAHDYNAVQGKTKCGTGCGSCKGRIEDLIKRYKSQYFDEKI
ncbi:iron-sulfur cluster assembly scaffold protein [Patescibacteria group bacterium]|nr:iron-sulfur cluster assembly scaffold protein [Patescibacteria group bacterium]